MSDKPLISHREKWMDNNSYYAKGCITTTFRTVKGRVIGADQRVFEGLKPFPNLLL